MQLSIHIKKSTIHIEATKIEGQAVIKVRDEGIGIAKEHLPYIEQSFYQINNHAAGAGIGLAIVKKNGRASWRCA